MNLRLCLLPLVLAASARAADEAAVPADFRTLSAADRLGLRFDALASAPTPPSAVPPPGALQMPTLVVHGHARLTGEDVMTAAGALQLARRTYISPLYQVSFGPLSQLAAYLQNPLAIFGGWHPSDAEATVLAAQDRRLERRHELDSLLDLESIGQPKDRALLQEIRSEAALGR